MLYRFGDLIFSSDVPFSQLPETTGSGVECSFTQQGDPRAAPVAPRWDHHWRSASGRVELSCSRDGDSYRLGVPDLATFSIADDGRAITCWPCGSPSAATLEHLVIDQVLPRILVHRGRLVLHAGGIETQSGAVAFLGESGAGKSTLCAAFARNGHRVLGDDGLVTRACAAGGFEVIATYPGLRLMPHPLAVLFDGNPRATPVGHLTAKRRLRAGEAFDVTPHPVRLAAIYLLAHGPRIEVAPVPGRQAFVALVRASFQLHLDDAARSRDMFSRIGAILDAIPVRRLSYPRELALLPDVRRAVLEDASAVGTSTRASSAGCACS